MNKGPILVNSVSSRVWYDSRTMAVKLVRLGFSYTTTSANICGVTAIGLG